MKYYGYFVKCPNISYKYIASLWHLGMWALIHQCQRQYQRIGWNMLQHTSLQTRNRRGFQEQMVQQVLVHQLIFLTLHRHIMYTSYYILLNIKNVYHFFNEYTIYIYTHNILVGRVMNQWCWGFFYGSHPYPLWYDLTEEVSLALDFYFPNGAEDAMGTAGTAVQRSSRGAKDQNHRE